MDAPFARVVRVERTGSTNADLRAAALADPGAWPHGSVLVAEHQEAGKGRAGRTWVTPPGTALTASILVRLEVRPHRLGWLPLLTGLAVQRACARLLATTPDAGAADPTTAPTTPAPATARPPTPDPATGSADVIRIKWPNDVLAVGAGADDIDDWGRDRKLAGILVEALPVAPDQSGLAAPDAGPQDAPSDAGSNRVTAVVGVGLNVAQTATELPVTSATSLRLLGTDFTPEQALTVVGEELFPLLDRWQAAGGDAVEAGLAEQVATVCATLGAQVRTELPGGPGPAGTAVGLDDTGRLVVETDGGRVAVAAGDVVHLRPAAPQASPSHAD